MIYFLPTGNCCTAGTAYCLYCSWPDRAPRSGSQPRRPSCICSGLEPHCRTSRCARPQPTPSPRCCSLTSLPGTANCTYRGYCHCINCGTAGGGPLSLRATRSGRQSRRRPATTLASELHHRTVLLTATSCTAARQLSGWSRQIHTGFLGPRATWEILKQAADVSSTGVLPSTPDLSHVLRLHQRFLTRRPAGRPIKRIPTTPHAQPLPGITRIRFGLIRFRSPLLPESRLFSLPLPTVAPSGR